MSALHHNRPVFTATLPACAGYCVLDVVVDDQGYPSEAVQYPVIGWALEEGSLAPYPVTLEGVRIDGIDILQPDGRVECPWIGGFANIEDWLTHQQDEYTRSKTQR